MNLTIIKMAWPVIERLFAKRLAQSAADYLNQRRENRLSPPHALPTQPESVLPPEPPHYPPPVIAGFSAWDVFWFTLSGVIFGGAMGFIAAYVARHQNKAENFS